MHERTLALRIKTPLFTCLRSLCDCALLAMLVTCTETQIASAANPSISPMPTSYGLHLSPQIQDKEKEDLQKAQERMPPMMSLLLLYVLIVLLVLNVEIVVPTADQYATRLGASESFSGLVIALTPFWQGILGIPMNYAMLRCGAEMGS